MECLIDGLTELDRMRKEMDVTYLKVLIREFACKELRETTENPATSHMFSTNQKQFRFI
jgi:hypothetical protein